MNSPANSTLLTYKKLMATWPAFEQSILSFSNELGLTGLKSNQLTDISAPLLCDHVALRVNSNESAQALKQEFEQRGRILSDNQINGRSILIFQLFEPLKLGNYLIDCVELPFPGDKHYPVEGWEHIELVLPSGSQNTDDLAQQLIKQAPHLAAVIAGETEVKVKMSSPKGDKERLANPTIAFKQGNICIKIHPHGIKAVIASEQS